MQGSKVDVGHIFLYLVTFDGRARPLFVGRPCPSSQGMTLRFNKITENEVKGGILDISDISRFRDFMRFHEISKVGVQDFTQCRTPRM